MMDMSLDHLDTSGVSLAASVTANGRKGDVQECAYEDDIERNFDSSGESGSGAQSIHEGDFKEKQVSQELARRLPCRSLNLV
jgi:hypothetical protein